jgi:hypothetical protein
VSNEREIKFENMELLNLTEKWNNISINYNNINIRLASELTLNFEYKKNDKKILKGINSMTSNIKNDYCLDTDIFKEEIRIIGNLLHIYNLLNDTVLSDFIKAQIEIFSNTNSNLYNNPIIFGTNINSNNFNEYIRILVEKYNFRNDIKIIILLILNYHFPVFNNKIYEVLYGLTIILDYITSSISTYADIEKERAEVLVDLFFNKTFTTMYFLDVHLSIPIFIKEYIIKQSEKYKKYNISWDGFKAPDYYLYTISFYDNKNIETKLFNNNTLSVMSLDKYFYYVTNNYFNNSLNRLLKRNKISLKKKEQYNYYINDKIDNKWHYFRISGISPTFSYKYNTINMVTGRLRIPLENIIVKEEMQRTTLNTSASSTTPTTSIIKFYCEGISNEVNKEEINKDFNDFINEIKSNKLISENDKTNVNISKIRLNKKPVNTEIPNPEYQNYLDKKEMLEKMVDPSKKNESSDVVIKELATIPPKTLSETTIKKEVITEIINTDYKSFDTMYLREDDEKKLLSVLSKFQNNKELLKSLGLPNKLCVMLDGLPGTGKSSTILTIASYLKKDIYYLSFGDTIETNEDLQMIFDHVVKNCNGGIIVAEDIDAVGSLLHSRTKHSNDPKNQTNNETKNEKLSLAYVLNLLQGTITPDNLIFIATTNHIEMLDPAFYRHGRFDVRITFKLANHYQLNKIYNKFFERNIPNDLIIRIKENKFTPAQFIFTIKDYISDNYSDEIILQDFIE